MGLKTFHVETKEDFWKGPWGEISSSEVRCLSFVREVHGVEERLTYPYETLLRWKFKKSSPQELEILAGGDTIVVRGHGLEKFLDALGKRSVVRIEQQSFRFGAYPPSECSITEIKIETST